MNTLKQLALLACLAPIIALTGCTDSNAKAEETYKSDSQKSMDNMKKDIDVSKKDADAIIDAVK